MTDLPRFDVLGIGIHAVNMDMAVEAIAEAIRADRKGYVCARDAHGIVEAQKSPRLRSVINSSFLTVPDGMPLVWIGWLRGHRQMDRVYGPDLMERVCQTSCLKGWTHFLCGGRPGVAEELKRKLEIRFRGIRVLGAFCPPFRPLTAEEEEKLTAQLRALQPDIVWVGMSTPKQEFFMADYLPRLETKIMIGVGAAFDFHTGRVRQAPRWIQRSGMEWCFRLCMEPRRLGRRYMSTIPRFAFLVLLEQMRIRGDARG
ncbi:MAG: WecB/TagA/CpsF family glycosyltransferase [Verrucomicrobiota bacterium]|nr:WecB/TagA/CpsF family glycosyltransferase [Verrucomicrobiota bacterium]